MTARGFLRRLAGAVGFGLAAAAPAQAGALATGDVLLCKSSEGQPSVLAWVGRIERWADHGVTGAVAQVALAHLQVTTEGGSAMDLAAHIPFEAVALSGCQAVEATRMIADPVAFEEGYDTWRDAVRDGAGAFTIGPADAYWAAMGIRDGAMGS